MGNPWASGCSPGGSSGPPGILDQSDLSFIGPLAPRPSDLATALGVIAGPWVETARGEPGCHRYRAGWSTFFERYDVRGARSRPYPPSLTTAAPVHSPAPSKSTASGVTTGSASPGSVWPRGPDCLQPAHRRATPARACRSVSRSAPLSRRPYRLRYAACMARTPAGCVSRRGTDAVPGGSTQAGSRCSITSCRRSSPRKESTSSR